MQIVDESDNVLGPNKPGEIRVKGPQVMKGYLNNPKATADTIRRGWLYTGIIILNRALCSNSNSI